MEQLMFSGGSNTAKQMGKNLGVLRNELGYTRNKVADYLGCGINDIYQMEEGKVPVSSDRIDSISKLFMVSPETLMTRRPADCKAERREHIAAQKKTSSAPAEKSDVVILPEVAGAIVARGDTEQMLYIGRAVRALRICMGWGQRELAKNTIISQGNISMVEQGRKDLTQQQLESLAYALKVRPATLRNSSAIVCVAEQRKRWPTGTPAKVYLREKVRELMKKNGVKCDDICKMYGFKAKDVKSWLYAEEPCTKDYADIILSELGVQAFRFDNYYVSSKDELVDKPVVKKNEPAPAVKPATSSTAKEPTVIKMEETIKMPPKSVTRTSVGDILFADMIAEASDNSGVSPQTTMNYIMKYAKLSDVSSVQAVERFLSDINSGKRGPKQELMARLATLSLAEAEDLLRSMAG